MTYRGSAEDFLRFEFTAFLRREGRDARMLSRAVLERVECRGAWRLRCEFGRGGPWFIDLPPTVEREVHGLTGGLHDSTLICRATFSQAYEDHMVELEQNVLQLQYEAAVLEGATLETLTALQGTINEREENIRRHHRGPVVPQTARPVSRRPGLVEWFSEDNLFFGYLGQGPDVGSPESQARGLALLKSWLTPTQIAQYEKDKHFEVIGGETGKRYRINHGRQMNIDELDADGNKVCGWCFLPEGGLVAGDVMLAQKIALETTERAALKTANRFGSGGGGGVDLAFGIIHIREWARPDGFDLSQIHAGM
jgi:hypothetical protein